MRGRASDGSRVEDGTMSAKRVVMAAAAGIAAVFCGYILSWAGERSKTAVEVMKLPEPSIKGTVSVEEAIAKRRSVRAFSGGALTIDQIGQLLWAAQGVTEKRSGFRAAPSAGALYPLEVYVVSGKGVFKYVPAQHSLRTLLKSDVRGALSAAALNQRSVATAPACLVITAVYARTAAKYGDRAKRYADIEAGAAGENVFLQAVALGLGSVAVGAFDDAGVAAAIKAERGETPLLIIPVGKPPA